MNLADVAFPHLGIYIDYLPKNFELFGVKIAYYGVIIAFGMLAGLWMACHQAKVTGQKTSVYLDYVVWGIIISLIGARLYYVAFAWDRYKDDLLQIFNLRAGGLAIYGGVIGAILSSYVYCRIKKYDFFLFADTAICGLILGQVIGRWGNFMNHEAFGEYTDSFLAMRLDTANVNPSYITSTMSEHMVTAEGHTFIQVHPTFLYESLWNLMVLLLLLFFTKRKKFHGQILLMYLIGYGLGRVWIEGLRTDQLQIGSTGIAISQVLSGVLVVAGIVVWIIMYRKATPPVVPAAMAVKVDGVTDDLSEAMSTQADRDFTQEEQPAEPGGQTVEASASSDGDTAGQEEVSVDYNDDHEMKVKE